MSERICAETWQARAAGWELLALSLRYPESQLVDAVISREWVDAGREIAGLLGVELPGEWGRDLLDDADATDGTEKFLHVLRAEATRLFVGAPDPACSPYEGVWRAAEDGVQALLFVNPHSMDVERFCKACGLGRPEGTNEPLDHVATECELLEHLALRAADDCVADATQIDDKASEVPILSADLPGGSAAAAYEEFFAEHIRTWVSRFSQSLEEEMRIGLYRSTAQLLRMIAG